MKITVKCYSGHRVDETPRSIQFDSRVVEVKEVQDQWIGTDHRYFKILWIPARAPRFVITHDKSWDLAGMTSCGTRCSARIICHLSSGLRPPTPQSQ